MMVPKKVGSIIHAVDQGDAESIASTGATIQTVTTLEKGFMKMGRPTINATKGASSRIAPYVGKYFGK